MRDMQAISDVITLGIKAAMAPVLERLAVAEAKAARVLEAEQALTVLRERVATWEAKAVPASILPEPVDLTPLHERIAGLEAQAVRVPVIELSLAEMRDKLVTLETKSVPEHIADPVAHERELSALRERLAVVETRAAIPGPPGKDGAPGHDGINGKDGLNGKDGVDGFAFEDLSVVQHDKCSFTIKAIKGDRVKDIGTATFPWDRYEGVYHEGRTYEPGECVTWGGSEWHCNETTSAKPGDGSKAWTLKVKRGRDGKDGKDAPSLPIVTVGR